MDPLYTRIFMKSRPQKIPIHFLQEHFMDKQGNLSVEAVIIHNSDLKSSNFSVIEPTWIFKTTLGQQISPLTSASPATGPIVPPAPLGAPATPISMPGPSNLPASASVQCNQCRKKDVTHSHYKCLQCVDYDLCFNCFAQNFHDEHVFALIDDAQRNAKISKAATTS